MKINQHWLTSATITASPNHDNRPMESDISLIVLHCISLPPQQFGNNYIDDFFCNRLNSHAHPYFKTIAQLKVSAHVVIKRTGEIVQYVAFNQRAWHAGQSNYQGREKCNDFSIGIELEGSETQPYHPQQYQQLQALIQCLFTHYPSLSTQHITRHSDIAPQRKTDPGDSFNWLDFLEKLT